ncbi:hypothetical protein DIPPA_01288 [Diplonema papillatum]|nr:hypothetical protein DIPPA_01288 [Diplonema papillatum]
MTGPPVLKRTLTASLKKRRTKWKTKMSGRFTWRTVLEKDECEEEVLAAAETVDGSRLRSGEAAAGGADGHDGGAIAKRRNGKRALAIHLRTAAGGLLSIVSREAGAPSKKREHHRHPKGEGYQEKPARPTSVGCRTTPQEGHQESLNPPNSQANFNSRNLFKLETV